MFKLAHNDDGKQKYQSHTVSILYKDKYDCLEKDFMEVVGYGETYEEALENFKEEFSKVFGDLSSFKNEIFEGNAVPVEVDYAGDPINKEDIEK